jgi:hypothetical protein
MVTIDGLICCQRILLSSTNLEGHNSPGTNTISAFPCKDEMKINAGPSALAVMSLQKVDSCYLLDMWEAKRASVMLG